MTISRPLVTMGGMKYQSTIDEAPKLTSGWQKKVIDATLPTIQEFAEDYKGTVKTTGNEVSIRVYYNGYMTIQIATKGKQVDCVLEISGITRSGIETSRTVFAVKQPDLAIDLLAFRKALDAAVMR